MRARLRWSATGTRSGEWLAAFRQAGSVGLTVEHTGGSPALASPPQAESKAALQAPVAAGIKLAHSTRKVGREFVRRRFGSTLSRSSCLNYLHRLGPCSSAPSSVWSKPTPSAGLAFVREYALLRGRGVGHRCQAVLRRRGGTSTPTWTRGAHGSFEVSQPWWARLARAGFGRPGGALQVENGARSTLLDLLEMSDAAQLVDDTRRSFYGGQHLV